MMNEFNEKRDRIQKLLEEDEIFMVYKNSHDRYAGDFERVAGMMPDKVRNSMFGYADSAQQMLQRALNVICREMEFKEEK